MVVAPNSAAQDTGERKAAAERKLQLLWFELTRVRPFRMLAVVAADEGVPVSPLAHDLARVAALQSPRVLLVEMDDPESRLEVADCDYDLITAPEAVTQAVIFKSFIPKIRRALNPSEDLFTHVILAAAHPERSTAGIPLIHEADAAVLAVQLGTTRIGPARRALDLISRDIVLGSLIVANS